MAFPSEIINAVFDSTRNELAAGNDGRVATKTVTFTGAAGNGATGTVALFTVTGDVLAIVFATCTADLTSSGAATIEAGISGNTAGLIAQATATTIDTGESWTDATPTTIEALPTSSRIIANGADIIATIATAEVATGTLKFYCLWRPLSSDGNVVAA